MSFSLRGEGTRCQLFLVVKSEKVCKRERCVFPLIQG